VQLGGVFVDFALGGVRVKGHVEGVLVGGTFWDRVWWRENSELVLTESVPFPFSTICGNSSPCCDRRYRPAMPALAITTYFPLMTLQHFCAPAWTSLGDRGRMRTATTMALSPPVLLVPPPLPAPCCILVWGVALVVPVWVCCT